MKFIRDIINEKTRAASQAEKADLHYPLLLREEERADAEVDEGGMEQDLPGPIMESDQEIILPSEVEETVQDANPSDVPGIEEEIEASDEQYLDDSFELEGKAVEDSPVHDELDEPDTRREECSAFLDTLDDAGEEEAGLQDEPNLSSLDENIAKDSAEDAFADDELTAPEKVISGEVQTEEAKASLDESAGEDEVAEISAPLISDTQAEEARVQKGLEISTSEDLTENLNERQPLKAEEDLSELPSAVSVSKAASGRASSRGRVKTRLLGFSAPQSAAQDPLDRRASASQSSYAKFPVGWLAVVDGPGTGATFPLFDGLTQIGRGEGQGVCLDFGDNSISRENHAAIAYDDEQRRFYFGQGGKANLVRLNGRPTLSTEEMETNSIIRIGETTLRFVALCGDDFSWRGEGKDDMLHAKIG